MNPAISDHMRRIPHIIWLQWFYITKKMIKISINIAISQITLCGKLTGILYKRPSVFLQHILRKNP